MRSSKSSGLALKSFVIMINPDNIFHAWIYTISYVRTVSAIVENSVHVCGQYSRKNDIQAKQRRSTSRLRPMLRLNILTTNFPDSPCSSSFWERFRRILFHISHLTKDIVLAVDLSPSYNHLF